MNTDKSPTAFSKLTTNLKLAAVKMLGIDDKARRAVDGHFTNLSEQYKAPSSLIRVDIRIKEAAPVAELFVRERFQVQLTTTWLFKIFAGDKPIVPGVKQIIERKVAEFLKQEKRNGANEDRDIFLRLSPIGGKTRVFSGSQGRILREIPIAELVAFFA